MNIRTNTLTRLHWALVLIAIAGLASCSAPAGDPALEANMKMYSRVWDEVMNKGKIDMISDENFSTEITIYSGGTRTRGIDSVKAYYGSFLTGFSNIQFTINDIFGQGDKMVKHWTFKGTHTGVFFGIAPTGKSVSLEGTTLIRMANGKIIEERDFYDNLEFFQQLGLIPR